MARIAPDLLDPDRYPFTIEIPTRFADVDPNDHINNVALAAAFEDARVRFDRQRGVRAQAPGQRVVIAAAYIDYLSEAQYPAPLIIHLGLIAMSGRSWTLAQLARQGDRACALCRATLVLSDGARAVQIPDMLRSQLDPWRIKGMEEA